MTRTKQTFNLILTLALWLVAAQTVGAVELTKTFSFSTASLTSDYLSIKATDPDDNTQKAILTVNGTMMDVYINSNPAFEISNMTSAVSGSGNEVQLFISPYVDGKVTKVEFTKAGRRNHQGGSTFSMSIDAMKYNGTDDVLTGVGASGESTSFTFISTDAAGIAGNLTMRLGVDAQFFINKSGGCQLVITYIPSVEPTHSHDFTFNAVGNTLTATCGHSDGLDCSLADANYQATLTLTPPTESFYRPGTYYSASHNLPAFNTQTGLNATTSGIRYTTDGTNYTDAIPNAVGNYTARLIVTIGGTNYTLTQSFRIVAYSDINNIYPQLNISTDEYASTTMAAEGQTVTITFTPQFGETLTGLTVTGTTTNLSIGSSITSIGNNKYTFTMPAEDVNISATFSISENDFAQSGNTYTIKTANGWNWFCFALNYGLAPDGFSGKTVKLAANVSSSEMAGAITLTGETPNGVHPFKGTFDGQGYTLTFNHNASEHYCAPFRYTDGATIRNLHVVGTITGNTYKDHGGLVGLANGNITIDNCRVSTQISTTYSGSAWHGGVIANWKGSDVTCTVTGCVYDGLIYNPSEADATSYCSGFIGLNYGTNMTIAFTDCLFAPAAYGTGKYALDDYCFTFVYPSSSTTYNVTNCYYTTALGKRQGRPTVIATTAPTNLGSLVTDRELVDGYQNGLLFNSKYYTPKYGELAVEYSFDDILEQATTTIDRTLYRDGDWNTLCLPFSQSAYEIANSSLNNAVIMELNSSASNLDNEGLLTLYFLPATSIVAGRPYIVKWSYDDTANPLKPIFNPSDEFVAALGFINEVPTVDRGQTSNWGTAERSENYDMLVDGDTSTKYGLSNADPYVEFHYQTAITPKGYALWTANDTEGMRNPKQWSILAKKTSSADWTTLITVDNTDNDKLPKANNLRTVFALNNNEAYQYFRFEAKRRSNSGQMQFQLAELQFCTVQPVETLLPHTDIVSPVFPISEANINTEASTEVNFDGGQFIGTLSPVEVSGGDMSILFLGAANTLYYPSRAMTIGAYRAYFQIGSSAGIKDFRLNFGEDDEATGLTPIPSPAGEGSWYDLNGRKLQGKPSQKGIYIVNGKKVLY